MWSETKVRSPPTPKKFGGGSQEEAKSDAGGPTPETPSPDKNPEVYIEAESPASDEMSDCEEFGDCDEGIKDKARPSITKLGVHHSMYNNRAFDIETIKIRFSEVISETNPYKVVEQFEREVNNLGG